MKITVLMENTGEEPFVCEHGLSLLIEGREKPLLFDTGASEMFLSNAQLLHKNIDEVECCVLSHGHYDHGGGLLAFLQANSHATVYMKPQAREHMAKPEKYLGLNPAIFAGYTGRICFVEEKVTPQQGFTLLPQIEREKAFSNVNRGLYVQKGTVYAKDLFEHELMMLCDVGDGMALFTGCAHNGVINMLHTAA